MSSSIDHRFGQCEHGFSADIAAEIDKVQWCDLLILQFPLWWYSVPAIMKGWFDRVFVNGLMYGQFGRFDQGGMRGKRAMVSTTTGCFPGMVGEGGIMGHLDAVLWHLQYGTLAYVGFDVLEPFVTWSVRYEAIRPVPVICRHSPTACSASISWPSSRAMPSTNSAATGN